MIHAHYVFNTSCRNTKAHPDTYVWYIVPVWVDSKNIPSKFLVLIINAVLQVFITIFSFEFLVIHGV